MANLDDVLISRPHRFVILAFSEEPTRQTFISDEEPVEGLYVLTTPSLEVLWPPGMTLKEALLAWALEPN